MNRTNVNHNLEITAKNRLEIVNWRKHGENESYCYRGAYLAGEQLSAQQEIQSQVDADYDWDQDVDAEEREDFEHVVYVNDDIRILDGDVVEHNGRKFRVTITEVNAVCHYCGAGIARDEARYSILGSAQVECRGCREK